MANTRKTVIVTGASRGIGAGLVKAFLDRGYQVVANSRNITKSGAFEASDELALFDGSIAEAATAAKIAEVVKSKFRIDRRARQQCRHLFLEALHGLHGGRSAVSRFRQHPATISGTTLQADTPSAGASAQVARSRRAAERGRAAARLRSEHDQQAGGALGDVVVHPCLRHFADFIGRSLGLT